MELNEKLRQLRVGKNLTQEQLAEKLYVSRTAVSKWESGGGYPSIDSLKQLSEFYGVSLDELLSGDALLNLAEKENRQKENDLRSLFFGLLDCSAVLYFFLPLFAEREETIRSVSLMALAGVAPYMLVLYRAVVLLLVLCGAMSTILNSKAFEGLRLREQSGEKESGGFLFREQNRERLSLILGAAATLLFTLGMQPYAAALAFVFLCIKAILKKKAP